MVDRGRVDDGPTRRYVTATPSPPGIVSWLTSALVAVVLLIVGLFGFEPGGRPLFATVIFAATAVGLVVSNGLFQAGNQGRLGKRLTVDGEGVLIESQLTRLLGVPAPIRLPAEGLIYHLPDARVTEVVRDRLVALYDDSAVGSMAGPFMRWVYAEQAPPTQHRVVLGHTDPSVTWHSVKVRDAAAFVEALRGILGVPEPGRSESFVAADDMSVPVHSDGVPGGGFELSVSLRWRLLIGLSVVATMALTAWLRHSAWPVMMAVAAIVPPALWFIQSTLGDIVTGQRPSPAVPGRTVGHIVRSWDGSSYRKSRHYVADVVVTTQDGQRTLVRGAGGVTRCPLPNGSPVPVIPTRSGQPRYQIVYAGSDVEGRPTQMLVTAGMLVIAVWLLWVFDAVVGGL